jgi:hypothetical protein
MIASLPTGTVLGVIVALAVGYVFWAGVLDTGHRHYRAIKDRFFPDPPPPPRSPVIVLGAPTYSLSAVPLNERRAEQEKLLTRLSVAYYIENKEALVTITNVHAGVRRHADGREQRFEAFNAPALAPLEKTRVANFEVDREMFEGLVESDYKVAFVWWAHFTAPDGTRWEIAYDGATDSYPEPRVIG